MQPIFAVGDIHGQLDELHKALDHIARDPDAEAPVVFTGDFVDRGPQSREVIELLMQGQAEGKPWTCLMGNHDRYLLRYLEDPSYQDPLTSRPLYYTDPPIGGDQTLASYGVDTDPRRWPEDIHATPPLLAAALLSAYAVAIAALCAFVVLEATRARDGSSAFHSKA